MGSGAGAGRILLLNGTSSAGKSTLARALRPRLPASFHLYSSDQLAGSGFRPLDPGVRVLARQAFFDGFHRSIPAFASAGLDLLIEHIVEEQRWADDLAHLLAPFDTFWVGVHAPLAVVEERERHRDDRRPGEGAFHLKTHSFCFYDIEVDTTHSVDDNAEAIAEAWRRREAEGPRPWMPVS